MENSLTFGNLQVDSLIEALAEVQQEAGKSGTAILKMDKTGTWIYGIESTEVEDGAEWAIDPRSFMRGVIAWGDGEVLEEHMALVTDPVGDYGPAPQGAKKGWQKQLGFMLQCLTGEDKTLNVQYMTTSDGGLKAVGDMSKQLKEHLREDPTTPIPVVTLESEHYQNKKYGKIYTPVFELVRWASPADILGEQPALPEAEAEEPKAEEPERRRRRRA